MNDENKTERDAVQRQLFAVRCRRTHASFKNASFAEISEGVASLPPPRRHNSFRVVFICPFTQSNRTASVNTGLKAATALQLERGCVPQGGISCSSSNFGGALKNSTPHHLPPAATGPADTVALRPRRPVQSVGVGGIFVTRSRVCPASPDLFINWILNSRSWSS